MNLTIVAYHYVRDLARTRYPEIKGRAVSEFIGQLEYIERHYTFVSVEDVVTAAQGKSRLPKNGVLLTFDDGFADHFQNVLPLLHEKGIQGAFFPPARPVLEEVVLDVHKIHFILSCVPDARILVSAILKTIDENRDKFQLERPDAYWSLYGKSGRYDSAEVRFVKHMLQMRLPHSLRVSILDDLFHDYVSGDERSFAAELYMTLDQLRMMVREGMYVGSHGYNHCRMDGLSYDEQKDEVVRSRDFLRMIGAATENWVMCYPYGAHNANLRRVLGQYGCILGLTTEVKIAEVSASQFLQLPRLDTNDLPMTGDAPMSQWTLQLLDA